MRRCTHFAAEYPAQVGVVDLLHVPYKGGPEAIQDVMACRAAFTMAALSTALPNIRAGKLRALGVSTQARSPVAPEIATMAEQGYAGYDISLWCGVWGPAGAPAAVVQKLNADITLALQDTELAAAFMRSGNQPRSLSQPAFAAYVRDEIAKHEAIALSAKIEPQ